MNIHPTAIIDPGAELDSSVNVGPYVIIEKGVKIGKETTIKPHTVITGPTTIGSGNWSSVIITRSGNMFPCIAVR